MSLSFIIKLFIRLNLIPVSYDKESSKVHFSWYSFRTIMNLSFHYGLALAGLIYFSQVSYAFVPGTPMEYARYTFEYLLVLMTFIVSK